MEFWHIFGSFQRGSITVGRMDINWPSLSIFYATVDSFQASDHREGYILNKSENATLELFSIYMQNDAIQ